MTVIDTAVVVDLLLRTGVANQARELFRQHAPLAAPDVLVFELLAAMRRIVLRGDAEADFAAAAIRDLGAVRLELFPSMVLRHRAWELRDNMAAADGLFVALAELLGEPLATSDRALAAAARNQTMVETIELHPET